MDIYVYVLCNISIQWDITTCISKISGRQFQMYLIVKQYLRSKSALEVGTKDREVAEPTLGWRFGRS